GVSVLHVQILGNWLAIVGFVGLGALTFTSIGYGIASFAKTEEAANGMTSVVQFPLMFLSGIFFPLEIMPAWLRGVATLMPLTCLDEGVRRPRVGGPRCQRLGSDALILGGWLLVTFAISARFFRWQ